MTAAKFLIFPAVLTLSTAWAQKTSTETPAPTAEAEVASSNLPPGAVFQPYTEGPRTRDGIGKYYMGREISQVMGHLAAGWLERPEREREEKPSLLIKSLELAPDAVIADIGAGSGYFTFRLAEKVPEGRIYAVDIQPEMIALLESKKAETRARRESGEKAPDYNHVVPVLSTASDTKLPADAVDGVLLVDVYHEFAFPREMLASIHRALKPGGEVYLLEYRAEDPSVPIKPLHKMSQAQAKKEFAASGFRWIETLDFLPRQHFIRFRKPEAEEDEPASPDPDSAARASAVPENKPKDSP